MNGFAQPGYLKRIRSNDFNSSKINILTKSACRPGGSVLLSAQPTFARNLCSMIFKRSMVSELANSAGGVFTVLFTIVLAVGMVRILSLAAGGRIDNGTVLQMVLYNALTNLPPLLTLSLFIAVLMTMMRWWQDNEMVVWFSSGGRSLFSWVPPVLRFALPFVVAVGVLSIVISPWARSQTEITRNEFAQRDEVNRLAPGRFIETMGGKRVFFIESQGESPNEVGRIFMAERTSKGESTVTAERGTVEINSEGDRYIVLHNGRRHETALDTPVTRVVEFDEYAVRLDIKVDKRLESGKVSAQPMTVLFAGMTPDQQAQIFWRFSWPAAAFLLALFAIPLSASNPRAGRSLNIIIAALVFILYLNAISVVQTWIEQGKFGYMTGLFLLHGFVSMLCALFFIRRVYMMRWLPVWCSPWYWRRRLISSKEN